MAQPYRHQEDGVEARLARLESHVEHIQSDIQDIKADVRDVRGDIKDLRADARTDFRVLFGALITLTISLVAVMARGFGWI